MIKQYIRGCERGKCGKVNERNLHICNFEDDGYKKTQQSWAI